MGQTRVRSVPFLSGPCLLGLAALIGACGGGGGSSNAPSASPTPRPSPVLPIESPGPSRSTAEIILRNGDVLANELVVANIEDASLGSSNAAAVVVTIANAGNRSAIVVRGGDGSLSTVYDPTIDDAGIDSTTITRLRLAATGEMVFQSGSGLDSDRLHRIANGTLETLAGVAPGPVFPEFRILGNVRIGDGGVVAFVGGGQECEVLVGDDEPRVTCTNALYVANASGVTRLDDSEIDLGRQRPSTIRVEIDPQAGAWFSLPRRATAPMLLHVAGGEATTILTGETVLDGVGALNSVEAVAVNTAGAVLLEAGLQEFSGERRPQVLGILRGTSFTVIAQEGTALGGANIAALRGLGLDGLGRALFEARLGNADEPASQINSLWLGDDSGLVEIAREGGTLAGDDATILEILGSRVNAAGDVAFLTELGTSSGGVVQLEEVRATVRRADRRLVTIASTRHTAQFGALSEMQIVGYDEAGTLLLIGSRGRSSDRILLLGRSDQSTG